MDKGIHFISGLPRSGSTLLAALLRQNPSLHANITSPVGSLMVGALHTMSAAHEGSVFIDDSRRTAVLRGLFEGYYHDVHPDKTVLDTNRLWCSKLPTLKTLYPQAKLVCCVRHVPWIYDSMEQLVQRNALTPSKVFGFEASGTVYDRFETLNRSNGMVGFAWTGLRQAFYGSDPERLLLVRFETLTINPAFALRHIYAFLGFPPFEHDTENIDFDVSEFDNYLGTPGLHTVGRSVKAAPRRTILPPELFNRVAVDTFWNDPALNPNGVKVI
ncbi:sulfotransferase [Lichenihabitans sp. Uapishka_5]|uniref:sulfotransferase family protein n=1 Tax=Lichenihabitans sp. Uapishka_5 TaxID=3037302 RepID=UPI0029E800FC|nr:sulfotransferase [Lichenihabitans sp. Uapishka_5]MDX7951241.1 sulfotransferase [Lichenihabitans sp. Uapishka_5]